MQMELINPNPIIHPKVYVARGDTNTYDPNKLESSDIFDMLRSIKDPEHPYTLEQLDVVKESRIKVVEDDDVMCHITIEFTPTVPHCSLATTIGLCIREKLRRELPRQHPKIDIFVTPGSHSGELDVNKQINDKERVAAAMENPHLMPLIDGCIKDSD